MTETEKVATTPESYKPTYLEHRQKRSKKNRSRRQEIAYRFANQWLDPKSPEYNKHLEKLVGDFRQKAEKDIPHTLRLAYIDKLRRGELKTSEQDFSGDIKTLDVSTGRFTDSALDISRFDSQVEKTTRRSERYEELLGDKVKSGDALEFMFRELLPWFLSDEYGPNFDLTRTSIHDDLDRQTDAVLFDKEFSRTRFLFGLDFTMNASLPKIDPDKVIPDAEVNVKKFETKLEYKINRILRIMNGQYYYEDTKNFSIRFAENKKTGEQITAFYVPKLISYIDGRFVEELASHFYRKDMRKCIELVESIRTQFLLSLFAQAKIYFDYARKIAHPQMTRSYKKMMEKIKFMLKKDSAVYQSLNYKRITDNEFINFDENSPCGKLFTHLSELEVYISNLPIPKNTQEKQENKTKPVVTESARVRFDIYQRKQEERAKERAKAKGKPIKARKKTPTTKK